MEKENIFEKNIIQERIKSWAEKLIDLSGTNDLISYRDAKTISIKPSKEIVDKLIDCLLYTSPSPRDDPLSRMPSSA